MLRAFQSARAAGGEWHLVQHKQRFPWWMSHRIPGGEQPVPAKTGSKCSDNIPIQQSQQWWAMAFPDPPSTLVRIRLIKCSNCMETPTPTQVVPHTDRDIKIHWHTHVTTLWWSCNNLWQSKEKRLAREKDFDSPVIKFTAEDSAHYDYIKFNLQRWLSEPTQSSCIILYICWDLQTICSPNKYEHVNSSSKKKEKRKKYNQ